MRTAPRRAAGGGRREAGGGRRGRAVKVRAAAVRGGEYPAPSMDNTVGPSEDHGISCVICAIRLA
ncbi:hypothetical protein GCM10022420_039100 [Streptomyces iranensis]